MQSLGYSDQYIFPHNTEVNKPISSWAVLNALKKLNVPTTAHGLRHLLSTVLNEVKSNQKVREKISIDKDIIEAVLAHTDRNKVGGTYNLAQYLSQIKKLLEWWLLALDQCKTEDGNAAFLAEYEIVVF